MNNLLRLPAVVKATGLARPTLYLRVRNGLFPRPVKLSERASAWPENEVAEINAARIAGMPDTVIRAIVTRQHSQRTSDMGVS